MGMRETDGDGSLMSHVLARNKNPDLTECGDVLSEQREWYERRRPIVHEKHTRCLSPARLGRALPKPRKRATATHPSNTGMRIAGSEPGRRSGQRRRSPVRGPLPELSRLSVCIGFEAGTQHPRKCRARAAQRAPHGAGAAQASSSGRRSSVDGSNRPFRGRPKPAISAGRRDGLSSTARLPPDASRCAPWSASCGGRI